VRIAGVKTTIWGSGFPMAENRAFIARSPLRENRGDQFASSARISQQFRERSVIKAECVGVGNTVMMRLGRGGGLVY
jgi:hypothetical protein